MLIYAIIFITSALLFYTIGVWSCKIQKKLKKWHLIMLYLGLISDILGTIIMSKIAAKGFQFNFHGLTGLLGIILMLLQALWGTKVIKSEDENAAANFLKFIIPVWVIWLIAYISGAILGMSK
jgi:uncharacterized repeat protein (TIGR03987 family)